MKVNSRSSEATYEKISPQETENMRIIQDDLRRRKLWLPYCCWLWLCCCLGFLILLCLVLCLIFALQFDRQPHWVVDDDLVAAAQSDCLEYGRSALDVPWEDRMNYR